MKVLYDSQAFTGQKFGGISGYFSMLITNRRDLFDCEVSGLVSNNIYVNQFSKMHPFFDEKSFKGKSKLMKLINRIDDKKCIQKENYDLFHPTYYEAVSYPKSKPVVVTAHDFNAELLPDYFLSQTITEFKRKSFEKADRIICISENTRNDLLNLFPSIPEEKTTLVYHALSWPIVERALFDQDDQDRYILFTGVRKGYKNFERFVRAISSLLGKYQVSLLCTGEAFSCYENELFTQLGIEKQVKHIFAKDEKELQSLYRKALLFVFPSLYEGFGFPILEAFSAGCPVVLSNSSCFPEIAGDAGYYFDPLSEESIKEAVDTILNDSSMSSNLRTKGYLRAKRFSVDNMIEKTVEVYRCVI